MTDFYKLLGVEINATHEQITKAYREKAKDYHADKNLNAEKLANELMSQLNEAKETLLDPQKRLEYDYKMGFKKRPEPPPRVVVRKETDWNKVAGVSLIMLIIGFFLGKGGKKR
jgi:DnaJ-class molecular chaperone